MSPVPVGLDWAIGVSADRLRDLAFRLLRSVGVFDRLPVVVRDEDLLDRFEGVAERLECRLLVDDLDCRFDEERDRLRSDFELLRFFDFLGADMAEPSSRRPLSEEDVLRLLLRSLLLPEWRSLLLPERRSLLLPGRVFV